MIEQSGRLLILVFLFNFYFLGKIMALAVQNRALSGFSNDKLRFFANFSDKLSTGISKDALTKTAEQVALTRNYACIANNRIVMEQEIDQMFNSLKAIGGEGQAYWLYCYYCCVMLKGYYSKYGHKSKVEEYEQLRLNILALYRNSPTTSDDKNDETIQQKIVMDLGSLASTPLHTTKIRSWLGFVNIYRIHFVFCRLAIKQILVIGRELHVFDFFDKLFGRHANVDGMIAIINAPTPVFNVLSVGLFAGRLFVNLGLLLKHTFDPADDLATLSKLERFKQELYKRGCTMLNDIVWASVNGLTNYSTFFHISGPVANWLLAGFLFFDVSLLLFRRYLEKREYLAKKLQYETERDHYLNLLQDKSLSREDCKNYNQQLMMLAKQLDALKISWKASSATYLFNASAAALLMAGFTVSLLFPGTVVGVGICYLFCTVAVAMYLSDAQYKAYKEKSLALELIQKKRDPLEMPKMAGAMKAMQEARRDFILTMVKNITIPLLIVTTFAVCWPAAIILTAAYIGYECTKGYFTKTKKKPDIELVPKQPQLKLPAPVAAVKELELPESDRSLCCC